MGDKTKIEWCDASWSPVSGCTKVSAGCANCYAERMVSRFGDKIHGGFKPDPYSDPTPFSQVVSHPDRLGQPLAWRKPRRVFVCSMGDLFHENVPDGFIDKVFAAMALSPQHTFMLLTKRPQKMLEWFNYNACCRDRQDRVSEACCDYFQLDSEADDPTDCWPLPNVWLGVSAENQETADERIPLLLQTPAAIHFVSVEPMLGPVSLSLTTPEGVLYNTLLREGGLGENCSRDTETRLDGVICGGESGPGARPMHPDWARSLRDQCQAAGVPFFFKQMSRKAEIPSDLMIREFPCSR